MGGGRRRGRQCWRWRSGGSSRRTSRRQRRQFDCGRSRGLRRKVDPDSLLLRLNFTGFFFRRNSTAWNVGKILGHTQMRVKKTNEPVPHGFALETWPFAIMFLSRSKLCWISSGQSTGHTRGCQTHIDIQPEATASRFGVLATRRRRLGSHLAGPGFMAGTPKPPQGRRCQKPTLNK